MSHDPLCPTYGRVAGGGVWGAIDCRCAVIARVQADTRTATLAALRAELPTFSCYEPSRLIGTPCSCVVGMVRAIEIVEGMA